MWPFALYSRINEIGIFDEGLDFHLNSKAVNFPFTSSIKSISCFFRKQVLKSNSTYQNHQIHYIFSDLNP